MSGCLFSGMLVSVLLCCVNDVGGFGVVLVKGDVQGGVILVVVVDKGVFVCLLECGIGLNGDIILIDLMFIDDFEGYWCKCCVCDFDLWVVEVDIVGVEWFVVEMIFDD